MATETSITKRKVIMAMAPVCLILLYVTYAYSRAKGVDNDNNYDKYGVQDYDDDVHEHTVQHEHDEQERIQNMSLNEDTSSNSKQAFRNVRDHGLGQLTKYKTYDTDSYNVDAHERDDVVRQLTEVMSVTHIHENIKKYTHNTENATQLAHHVGYDDTQDLAMRVHLLECEIGKQVSEKVSREYTQVTDILQALCLHATTQTPMEFVCNVSAVFADCITSPYTQEERNIIDILLDRNLHRHIRSITNKMYDTLVSLHATHTEYYEHNIQLKKYVNMPVSTLNDSARNAFTSLEYTWLAVAHVLEQQADSRYAMVPSHFTGLHGTLLFATVCDNMLVPYTAIRSTDSQYRVIFMLYEVLSHSYSWNITSILGPNSVLRGYKSKSKNVSFITSSLVPQRGTVIYFGDHHEQHTTPLLLDTYKELLKYGAGELLAATRNQTVCMTAKTTGIDRKKICFVHHRYTDMYDEAHEVGMGTIILKQVAEAMTAISTIFDNYLEQGIPEIYIFVDTALIQHKENIPLVFQAFFDALNAVSPYTTDETKIYLVKDDTLKMKFDEYEFPATHAARHKLFRFNSQYNKETTALAERLTQRAQKLSQYALNAMAASAIIDIVLCRPLNIRQLCHTATKYEDRRHMYANVLQFIPKGFVQKNALDLNDENLTTETSKASKYVLDFYDASQRIYTYFGITDDNKVKELIKDILQNKLQDIVDQLNAFILWDSLIKGTQGVRAIHDEHSDNYQAYVKIAPLFKELLLYLHNTEQYLQQNHNTVYSVLTV